MEQIKDKSATLKKRKMSTESNAGDFLVKITFNSLYYISFIV